MIVKNFTAARTEVENGDAVYISNLAMNGEAMHYGIVQAKITGAITVKLQGRLSASFDWTDLATFTASGMQEAMLLPEMRYSITANGGTLNALSVGFVKG